MNLDSTHTDTGINLNELFARVEYDRDLLCDMLQVFCQEFPKLHALITAAVIRGDRHQVQASAHTLKGMFASLSFSQASASALRIERMARQANLTGVPDEIDRLAYSANCAQANLQRVCGREAW